MRTDKRSLVLVSIALAAVFIIKFWIAETLGAHPLLQPQGELDNAFYLHFAKHVKGGDFWLQSPDSFFGQAPVPYFISPLYIYALALFLTVGSFVSADTLTALTGIHLSQAILGTMAVVLVAWTAQRWYGLRAGWIAGAIAAGCGLFTFYESLLLQAAIDPFLSALDLFMLTRGIQNDSKWSWMGAGGALGLHALNRPNMLIVAGGLAILIALRSGFTLRAPQALRNLAAAAVFVLGAAIAIAPAAVRNYRVSGEVILVSSHGGLNLLIGNGPEADGTFTRVMNVPPTVRGQWIDAPRIASEAAGRPLSASETSAFFRARSIEWMTEHPHAEARLLAKKTWYALSGVFLTLNHSLPFYMHDVDSGLHSLFVGQILLLPLGLLGLIWARPKLPGYPLWAAYVPLCIVSVVLFFVAARYRLPYQVGLSVAAGGGASWLIDRIRAKLFRELVPALVAAGAALAVVVWPTGLSDGRAEEQVKMGLFEIDRGNITEGEAWISHAVDPSLPVNARHPFPGVVHLRAGQAHEDHKRFDAALEHYRQAARIDPDQPSLFVASARMLTQLGRPDEAVAELDRIPSNVSGDSIAAEYERAGTALVLTRRYDSILKAIDILEKAETRAPKAPSIRLNRAVALVMAGRTAEARDEAQAALDLDPGYAKAAEFLASLKKVPGF